MDGANACFLIFIFLYIIAAFRSFDVGTDTMSYIEGFVFPHLSIQDRNPGYNLVIKLLRSISDSPRFFLVVISFAIQFFIFLSIVKYTRYPVFAILIYALIFFCLSLNILRQFMVTGLFYYYGIDYILKRRWLAYAILMLILFSIHELSLVLVPLYFFSKKMFKPVFYLAVWLASVLLLTFSYKTNILTGFFEIVDAAIRSVSSDVPAYFNEVDSLYNSSVSLNGIYLDQLFFLGAFYFLFYSGKINITPKLTVFFNIFFAGIIFQNCFFFIEVVQRVSLLFLFSSIYVAALIYNNVFHRTLYVAVAALLFYVRFVQGGISGVFHQ